MGRAAEDEVTLSAYRGQITRYERLCQLYRRAEEAALEAGHGLNWYGNLYEIHDLKGDLTVVWRTVASMERYHQFIDSAWHSFEPGEDVVHYVETENTWRSASPFGPLCEYRFEHVGNPRQRAAVVGSEGD